MTSRFMSNMAKSMTRRLRSPWRAQKLENFQKPSLPDLDFDILFSDFDPDTVADVKAKTGLCQFLFSVVSWGAAATEWLAMTLNSHPDILCYHSVNTSWAKFGGAASLDGWKYLRLVGVSGPSYTACGDVHGISLGSIPGLREILGEHFNCAIVVREPLPRLCSQIALFQRSPIKSWWNVDYVQTFIDRGVRLPRDDIDSRLFLHGVNMLNSIIQEETVAPIWRAEDLTTDAAMLARFVEELTRRRVQVEPEWANRAVRRPPSNRHRAVTATAHQFEPWQVAAINQIVDARAWRGYQRLGYEIPEFVVLTDVA
jgi:hypothetical protein